MWINDKKVNFENIVNENGKIVEYKNLPVNTGLGDETVWKCTFENGNVLKIEFIPEEYGLILSNIKK